LMVLAAVRRDMWVIVKLPQHPEAQARSPDTSLLEDEGCFSRLETSSEQRGLRWSDLR
jgi:hypothetical protein